MKSFFLALVASVSFYTHAIPTEEKDNTQLKAQITANHRSQLWIGVEKPTEHYLEVRLMDEKNKILHRGFIKRGNSHFVQKLNLKELNDGVYFLYISTEKECITKTIFIRTFYSSYPTTVVLG
ncbi:hypothetical protein P1X15_20070 [Runella sp. MFBS21]|uniref:hypothetical protein n=1 Tax=Runella sp. MFBS21 TaxID=3034018 RepID=UPI0023F9243E|nr:hypothetical protein [Runella sp. MFBS21]MDF7819929.1 hypothetical protein [Runella sp. MFBS21]